MKSKRTITLMMIIIMCTVNSIVTQDDEDVSLQVNPHNLAVQIGENATMQCYHYPEGSNTAEDHFLEWFMPNYDIPISELKRNQTFINETETIQRYTSERGTLIIVNASEEDAGTFTCKNANGTLEVEAIFKVYVMPSYFTEAMVVIVINVVLLAIFIMCYVWRFVQDRKHRRDQRENRRRNKLGHYSKP